jgi:hypothetical protein
MMNKLSLRPSNKPPLLKRAALGLATFGLAAALAGCGGPEPSATVEAPETGTPLRTRLLTSAQYRNSIAQVFGDDVADSVLSPLPPVARREGLLSSGAAFVGLTSDQVSQIQQTATVLAARVVDESHRDFLIPCRPESLTDPDPVCAGLFLQESGRLLLRRPIEDERLVELVEIANYATEETEDFYEGLALALESLMISPDFLFITDKAEPDPQRPGEQRLDAFSLASRLSFLLWNSAPDDELLKAAESGELHTEVGLTAAVDRLLASPRLENGMRAFFDDMLHFDEFNSLAKDPMVYPMVTAATLADAREQTLRTIMDHLLNLDGDYRDLFTTRDTFMSPALAVVYGTPSSRGWVPYEFSEESKRSGLLTHVSFLAANSHSVRSSPTIRGKALRETFLCQTVPEPPPNIDFSGLEEDENAATARQRLRVHNENPSCAGCHLVTDPMGLSLENFDGAGRFRATENGAELIIAGELDGVFYEDVAGLAAAMRDHPKLPACLVNRLYSYGTGGPVSLRDDRAMLDYLESNFAAGQYRLQHLLKEMTLSPGFAAVRSETPEATEEQPQGAPARLTEEQFQLSASEKTATDGKQVLTNVITGDAR